MLELQAAVALVQLKKKLKKSKEMRRKEELSSCPKILLAHRYPEFVFRKAEEDRRTPFGYPLPDHVRYKPGLCPKAEEAAKRTLIFGIHHSKEPEEVRREVKALRKTMERHFK